MASIVERFLKDCGRLGRVYSESGLIGGNLRLLARLATARARERIITAPILYRSVAPRTAALIAGNKSFHDQHRGRTAFVVATGPSVARQDLSELGGHIVIAVNENFFYLKSRGVPVTYTLVQDDGFFDDKRYRAFWRDLGEAARASGFTPIIPTHAARIAARSPAWEGIEPIYFLQVGEFLAVADSGRPFEIDFTQPMPAYLTTTHAAIAWALFIGCREIKVLGVDLDQLENPGEPLRHCYGDNPYNNNVRLSPREAAALNATVSSFDLQARNFDRLGELGRRRNQSIIDAGLRGRAGNLPKQPLPAVV